MSSRNEEIWEERANRSADKWTDHPVKQSLKWLAIIVVAIFILGLVGKGCGFIGAWGDEAAKVVSPANVTEQYKALYTDYEALQATALNVCNAKNADTNNTLLEDPAFAYKAMYYKQVIDYNARWKNVFQAKIVGPRDIPTSAPTLEQMQEQVCP